MHCKTAVSLSGSAGPCGVEDEMLKHWLLRHAAHSERLWEAIANCVGWLSNDLPPYATCGAVNTVCTVALDKSPGFRPLGVSKVWMRLWSDCSHMKTKAVATSACGNTQLCAGLQFWLRPTCMLFGPSGLSWQDGPRTKPPRKRKMALVRQCNPAKLFPCRRCVCPRD
jgi:hypothetical protein